MTKPKETADTLKDDLKAMGVDFAPTDSELIAMLRSEDPASMGKALDYLFPGEMYAFLRAQGARSEAPTMAIDLTLSTRSFSIRVEHPPNKHINKNRLTDLNTLLFMLISFFTFLKYSD